MKISWLMVVPVVVFTGLAGLFAGGMFRDNPDELPSPFIGKPAPSLEAQPLGDLPSFGSDAMDDGQVKIVNFWASWCPPCRAEHPALMQLKEEGVPIYGVNKSDAADDALGFLGDLGNPFAAVTVDPKGRQAIDWGVVALPETFVIDGDGEVVLKFPGPIHGVMDTVIRPALENARAQEGA